MSTLSTESADSQRAPQEAATETSNDPVARLLAGLHKADTGTQARLRRFHPLQGGRPALFDSEGMLQAAGIDQASAAQRERWAVLLHCMALTVGHASGPQLEPGQALAHIRMSEARVKQLVEADADLLCELLPRTCRRLASEGTAVKWWPFADLLLYTGTAFEERADLARRRIVRAYLRAAADASANASAD